MGWWQSARFNGCAGLITLSLVGSFLSPESRWFLVRWKKITEAKQVLGSLYGSEAEAAEKLIGIERAIAEEMKLVAPEFHVCFPGFGSHSHIDVY